MGLEKRLPASLAVVIGGTGSIGAAFAEEYVYRRPDTEVMILGRETETKLDLLSEDSISDAAVKVACRGLPVSVIVVATGILHTEFVQPAKTWRQITQPALIHFFV